MVLRSSIDHELRPLVKALRSRISDLKQVTVGKRDGLEVFQRGAVPFLMLEIRRDHMSLDMWLPESKLKDARASGIARPHPFEPNDAVRIRFDRALDLTKVSRWLKVAHTHANQRVVNTTSASEPADEQKSSAQPSA